MRKAFEDVYVYERGAYDDVHATHTHPHMPYAYTYASSYAIRIRITRMRMCICMSLARMRMCMRMSFGVGGGAMGGCIRRYSAILYQSLNRQRLNKGLIEA